MKQREIARQIWRKGKPVPDGIVLIEIALKRGRCRWCRCTDSRACEQGCSWSDKAHTLCSSCTSFDRLMRSATGRRRLAQIISARRARRPINGTSPALSGAQ